MVNGPGGKRVHNRPRMSSTVRRRLLVLTLVAGATGCYSYATVSPASLEPGAPVRMRLTSQQAERVAPLIAVTDARLVSGRFVGTSNDTLIVEVPTTDRVTTYNTGNQLRQRLTLARADVLELERRILDRRQTTIVAGIAAAVVGAFLVKTLVIDPGRERLPPGGGGNELIRGR